MERAVGIFNRRIKSARAPGVNAGNSVELVSARHYLNRENRQLLDDGEDEGNERNGEDKDINEQSNSKLELWGPRLGTSTIEGISNEINVMLYLRNFWARERNLKSVQLPPLNKSITVGKRLFKDGNTYECSLLSRSTGRGSFLKVLLQVDDNALHTNVLPESKSKAFFGEAILFFSHKYMGM